TFGCNLKCSFCQNWTIAHDIPESFEITPSRLVQETEKNVSEGNIGIAYTYNEPSIWYEFVYETSKLIKGKGLLNVLVTNGFINSEPLENLMPYIDAMNIDVKAFNSSFYKDVCKGDGALEYIKSTIEQASQKCHLEVTTLVIPELNDSMDEIGELAKWLASISKDIVLHLSRYFPNYRMNKPATPLKTLNAAAEKASHYLRYVYLGNV
ncbi:MAG TPA: radical SAM protein, partial [Clostridiales bacterium]|nr:radical SAM protein [Clostridiales bacterium]